MRNIKNKINNMKGITLIALVITIVILIILSGITISVILGNEGIFNKTKTATQEYQNAQDYEEKQIAKYTNDIDSYIGGNRGTITLTEEEYEIFKNQTIVSTTEKKIGTWIDGKPLYRKIVSGTTASNTEWKILETITGADTIISIDGFITWTTTRRLKLPYGQYVFLDADGSSVRIGVESEGFYNKDVQLIVEYTKNS